MAAAVDSVPRSQTQVSPLQDFGLADSSDGFFRGGAGEVDEVDSCEPAECVKEERSSSFTQMGYSGYENTLIAKSSPVQTSLNLLAELKIFQTFITQA